MRKYLYLQKNQLQQELSYRAQVIINIMRAYLSTGVRIAIWVGLIGAGANYTLGLDQLINYSVWAQFLDTITNTDFGFIAGEIRRGEISKVILKPINILSYYFIVAKSKFLLYLLFFIPIVIIVGNSTSSSPEAFLVGICLLPISIIGFYLIRFAIGLSATWLGHIYGLDVFLYVFSMVFGGALIPYDMLPASLQVISDWFPLRYLNGIAIEAFTGLYQLGDLPGLLIKQLISLLVVAFVVRHIYNAAKYRMGEIGG